MSGHATGGEGLFAVFALPLLAAAIDAAAIVFLTVRPSIGHACYLAAAALAAIIVYALGPVDVFFVMTDRHLEAPFGLLWKGIEATEKLAASNNTKIVVIGNSKTGLPIILGEK